MDLPHWVRDDVEQLPNEFTGQIVIECWCGGVTRIDTKTIRRAPGGMKRDDRK